MPNSNKIYKVKANEFEFSFTADEINKIDFIKKSPEEFNIIKNNRSVNIRLLKSDSTGKAVIAEVDGECFTIEIKDGLDQMLEKMGFDAAPVKHIKEIKAPMPGLVLDIAVKEGQAVKEGEKILILEAMKMENSIMLHANATIKKINVKPGQAVDKGQVMIELE